MNGASKITIIEEEPQVRGIPSAPTSVVGAVGIAQRGPIGEAVLCSSFEEFQSVFGGFTPDSDLALAAMGFFENGGSQFWAVRTAHYSDVSDPKTVAAKAACGALVALGAPSPAKFIVPQDSETVDLSNPATWPSIAVDGGAPKTVAFLATQAVLTGTETGPFDMDGETLSIFMGKGNEEPVVVEFLPDSFIDITEATVDEVVGAINAVAGRTAASNGGGYVELRSATAGYESSIAVLGGTAAAKLGLSSIAAHGTGDVADLSKVTQEEIVAIVNATFSTIHPPLASIVDGDVVLTSPTTGPSSSITMDTVDGPMTVTGEDASEGDRIGVQAVWAGAYGNRIEVEIREATNGNTSAFDLLVLEGGVHREAFLNATLDPGGERYIESLVNASSNLIRVSDLNLDGGTSPLEPQAEQLSGGDDGLDELDDTAFIGSETGKTGLHALDKVQDLSLLLVPGQATPAVHGAMIRYCEVERGGMVFAILDPPENASATEIVEYVTQTASLKNSSEYAAIYWPRVKVLNPQKSVFGSSQTVVVPPSGIIAGVYGRNDAAHPGGVYNAPAGIENGRMHGVLGFETDEVLEERKRDLVYPHRINPLTTGTGLPRFIDGSRTLKDGGNFPYIAERRGVIFIERSVKQGLEFARHKNNTEGLRAQVRRTITAFLITQMNNGAFRSRDPAKAFFVDVSDQLNTQTVVFAGQLIARIGLATNKPAEFIVLRISQDTRALEAELAGR